MSKRKSTRTQGCALVALCAIAAPVLAQTATQDAVAPAQQQGVVAQESAAAAPASDQSDASVVVVTGSARPQRRFDVSYAVNALSQKEVQKLAPQNMADLLGKLPGIQVEATGGEVQNITRVRGIPTDDGLALFQQDGLPLFTEINGFFFRGDSLNRYDLMTNRLEVVRGGPAPIYASQAAAIVNSTTVTGGEQTRGKAQVTLGTTGLTRVDLMQSGKIDDRTYYAIGGFLREDQGHRDNGFPNDRGGQIRANIKRVTDAGVLKFSVNYLNDHNQFYLPIPIADPRNPSVSLDKYINYFDGTMNSPSLQNVTQKYRDSNGNLQTDHRDLDNGRHLQFGNVGVQFDGDIGEWRLSAKGGYTQGRLDFDAYYSTSNPADATAFANGFKNAATAAFGPVDHFGYAIAGTNGAQVYNPNSASGLVMQGQYRAASSSFYSAQSDINLTRNFQTAMGNHDVKFGVYTSAYGQTSKSVYNDMLTEVAGKPRTLDLIAYAANGSMLGSVTDNGVLHYTSTLNQGDTDAKMGAFYVNDTWEVNSRLRLDAGLRAERYHYNGYALLTNQVNLGDPTTLADDTTRAFTGARQDHTYNTTTKNWTAGANYDFSEQFGGYARISHLEVPPSLQVAATVDPLVLTTKADQYEVGVKAKAGRSYLYVTGFYTKFNPLNASFTAFNPVTGRNDQTVPFFGQAIVKGAEFDGAWYLTNRFYLNGSLTLQDPQYKNFVSSVGADPSQVVGNQIIREPKVFGNIRPSYNFNVGDKQVDVYGSYAYTGKRYVDFFNATELPAYHSFGAGVTVTQGDWTLQIVGDNLTNAKGLTEGNTRTDTLSGQGTQQAIYGRPVFGRSGRIVLSKAW
ncbi:MULTISPECIES: TonB-dependent receptor [unclassified Janthinobacterium]|uniref:TonB-dependent receptor n=1 Tax=unclassified Janthinobacterium TaxID=2610881 RepID=UPI0016213961|nr:MULTISPECIES: TonB-dependent receptor [unclassified Janthinobacterium]MBB5368679.1 outer membrane receptor protein involved in Fe transport [Janthinobacterium sp. K2C7]MBB5381785.1 outer membrane receptor protein involved in Fe transport [Janthinobacterium sp. K2Li3]MBB5387061.1 outer membrane receptor protein involved in Fe transport [Janthinobacterium sp. K2E3]